MNFEIIQTTEHAISAVVCILYKIFKRKFVITTQSHLSVYLIQTKTDRQDRYNEYRINTPEICESMISHISVLIDDPVYRYEVAARSCESNEFYHDASEDVVLAFIQHPTLLEIDYISDESCRFNNINIRDYIRLRRSS